MKPPRKLRVVTAADRDPIAGLISAFHAGRLVDLLRGEGLTGGTVRELLRPESAAKLRAILTERGFSGCSDADAGPDTQLGRFQPEDGKVLVFKAKETFRP